MYIYIIKRGGKMKNPFIYGEAVIGDNFADREKEMKELIRDLKDCEKIFLISPRRYGKTSLIINALNTLKAEGLYIIYIDLYKVTSLHKLLEFYVREITKAVENKFDRAIKFLKETLPNLRPKITIEPDGSSGIGIEYIPSQRDVLRFLDEIYDLPEKIAKSKNRKFVIAFDEFQEIRNFDGSGVEKGMRASFQHHKKVAYLFAGSKKHILYDMVSNKSKPFYKMGRVMTLNKIPRQEFADFLEKAFLKTGFTLAQGTIEKILDITENYPYNVQYLCHKLWDSYLDEMKISTKNIDPILEEILSEETPLYLLLWDYLSLPQRRLLQAIAKFGGKKVLSQEFIKANDLAAPATVQTSLRLLVKKEILDKADNCYFFTDVFFKEWVKRKT